MRKLISFLILLAIVIVPLLFVFGFAIKTQPEYTCALHVAEKSEQVTSATGAPLTPGLFAWTKFFESGGALRQGGFFTSISGPQGAGTIDVSFYRAPTGAALGVWFTSHDEKIEVYNDTYPCEDE